MSSPFRLVCLAAICLVVGCGSGMKHGDVTTRPSSETTAQTPAPTPNPPSVAVVVVADCSGSTSGPRNELMRAAISALMASLHDQDNVALLAFNDRVEALLPMTTANDQHSLEGAVLRLTPGGGTDIEPALEAAFAQLAETSLSTRLVILLTDGNSPYGTIEARVETAHADLGAVVSTVGLGDDIDEALLQKIAATSGGQAYKVYDAEEATRALLAELEAARERAPTSWFPDAR